MVLLCLALWSCSVLAQDKSGDKEEEVSAKLELTETDGQLEMSGYCSNQSGRTRSLSYKLKMLRVDSRGNRSSSNQGGMFELADGADRLLSTTAVNVDDGSYILVTLEIYEGEELLAIAREKVGEIPTREVKPEASPGRGAIPNPTEGSGRDGYGASGNDIQMNMGFVVDDTRTRAGSQFYDVFYRSWKEPQVDTDYIIRIEEKPARGINSLIAVNLNGEEIFSRMLQPKAEVIEELAEAVANYTYNKVIQQAQVGEALEHEQTGADMY